MARDIRYNVNNTAALMSTRSLQIRTKTHGHRMQLLSESASKQSGNIGAFNEAGRGTARLSMCGSIVTLLVIQTRFVPSINFRSFLRHQAWATRDAVALLHLVSAVNFGYTAILHPQWQPDFCERSTLSLPSAAGAFAPYRIGSVGSPCCCTRYRTSSVRTVDTSEAIPIDHDNICRLGVPSRLAISPRACGGSRKFLRWLSNRIHRGFLAVLALTQAMIPDNFKWRPVRCAPTGCVIEPLQEVFDRQTCWLLSLQMGLATVIKRRAR
ncbi:uncharacterized protein LAESUDRAFT_713526 [Laetiporus sulphureus 93-53]|uniref:Uncharacterized protein n=1 Tax=Laetiporus sulphureus 93-53 TaxID=1314785 RepID=A0A165EN75_9APHY|nr:uncharacterized protein LAESUDRAFT_713526 [Laetiporus sulphureus 93-53]KZT07415.1 hypothetical protein LAESUDRAFT_713526 [Laetiporus sulphureus 93-53]